jgi:hypothetical protein
MVDWLFPSRWASTSWVRPNSFTSFVQPFRLFQKVQVFPLEVLNQGNGRHAAFAVLPDQGGNPGPTQFLAGQVPPLPATS